MIKLGVLGSGDLIEKMVCGLLQHHTDLHVFLSPSSQAKSQILACHSACYNLPTHQAVVDASDLILLGTPPAQLVNLANEISLKPDQKLISLISGVSLADLSDLFNTSTCFRASASYSAEINHSTISLFPFSSCVSELLYPLGRLITLENEHSFELATIGSYLNGWFYFLLHDLQHWLHEKGLPDKQAKELVLNHLEDCIAYSRHHETLPLLHLGQTIASDGTFAAQGLEMLQLHQANAAWSAACEVVFDALSTPLSDPSNQQGMNHYT